LGKILISIILLINILSWLEIPVKSLRKAKKKQNEADYYFSAIIFAVLFENVSRRNRRGG
jgi:hypothetical protein